ncbi:MAG: hypothetical protein ACRCX2_24245 [Paraclostridium sp.]
MLLKTWLNVIFDEIFFYEFQKCQMRASYIINKNYTRRQFCGERNKIISVKASSYVPYDESLIYTIRKKIIFYTVSEMMKDDGINASTFKKASALIAEKEIQNNKKKSKRDSNYYDKIRMSSLEKIEELFNFINVKDFENSVKNCFTEKIKLPEIIESIRSGVMPGTAKSIPNFDYREEYPLLKQDILSIGYNEDTGALEIVIVLIFNITDKMCHRNFFLKILFRYFYSMLDQINYDLAIEANSVDVIKIYNPLTLEKVTVYWDDVKSSLAEMDLFRVMSAYIDNNLARTMDNSNCEYCENNKICYSKTRSRNKLAIGQTFEAERSKGKPKEMI